MRDSGPLDAVDRRILDILSRIPEISQTRLAMELGVSQPWIATRIKHLKERGVLTMVAGINLERLDLVLGMVGLSSKNPYFIARRYRGCPYFLRGLILSGERNLTLEFFGENTSSLQGIVDQHLRKEPDVTDVDFRLITHVLGDLAVCPRLGLPNGTKSPCGADCMDCVQYESGSCVGCPATVYYRGRFWNGTNRQHAMKLQPIP